MEGGKEGRREGGKEGRRKENERGGEVVDIVIRLYRPGKMKGDGQHII